MNLNFKEIAYKFLRKFVLSAANGTDGFSGRKMTAITVVLLIILLHICAMKFVFIHPEQVQLFTLFLYADYFVVLVCLSLIVIEKVNMAAINKKLEGEEKKE